MFETKHLLAALVWRGVRITPKDFARLCQRLPPYATEAEIIEMLTADTRLLLSFSPKWFVACKKDIEWIYTSGARLVTIIDPDYPEGLREFKDAPLALTVRGASPWVSHTSISIVGSRNPSQLAMRWLDYELEQFLAATNICVVSGGARGVDQKAHSMALRNNRPTVCFVPAGLGALYPRQLDDWVEPIAEGGGALVSTYAPEQVMERNLFIERNRYIAAISQCTLVVEAKRRSGTLVTARWATALDRAIGAVPCSPSAAGLGGLDVIVEGGDLIRDHQDLIVLAERGRVKSLRLFSENENQEQNSQ